MGILEKISEVEREIARTQKNKATEYHLGLLKAKLAKYRQQLLEPQGKSGPKGEGFDVVKTGDARVALIGFPSVGKSTFLSTVTETESVAASYEFTTLTCIPGVINYDGAKIQLLDLPGIIEGASSGKGRGRQVISVAKTADLVLMMLDAKKGDQQRKLLEAELEAVGIRLNQEKPRIYLKKKSVGGVKMNNTCPLTKVDEKMVSTVLHEYKVFNADVIFHEDYTIDQFIDVIQGGRVYVPCLYVYNKIDQLTITQMDKIARQPHSVVISCELNLNIDYLVDMIWEYLALIRIYTKKPGNAPDLGEEDGIILKRPATIESACHALHRTLASQFRYAIVWGTSPKFSPQRAPLVLALVEDFARPPVARVICGIFLDEEFLDYFGNMGEESAGMRIFIFIITIFGSVVGMEFRIGIIQGVESMAWHNARHAVDEWNNVNAVITGINLILVAPSDGFGSSDDKMCDIIQRKIIAIIISSESESVDEILLSYSMCDRFRIPCITTSHISPLPKSRFLTEISPNMGVYGKASAELITNLGWSSFLLVYQDTQLLSEVADLLSVWHNQRGTRTLLKVLQLPADPNHYEVFLKYVREKLRQMNLVIHTRDVGTIHAVLSAASFLNMTESKYSFMFTNPDLILLDDFFESLKKIYKCNITGFQLVQHDPVMKSSLALTMDSVTVIGEALKALNEHGNIPISESLICESDDAWNDGELLNAAIRQVKMENSLTGKLAFTDFGKRENVSLTAITRANGRFHQVSPFIFFDLDFPNDLSLF